MKQKFLLAIVFCLLTAKAFAQTDQAKKIDEFGVIPCDEYLARVDAMRVVQANNPNHRVYVFIYEGKETRAVYKNDKFLGYKPMLPQYGLATTRIESMKKYLKLRKVPLSSYVFLNGGFRENFGVEIWLVPPGVEPPKPTPTLEKMKYRKGKPAGFCLDCCGV